MWVVGTWLAQYQPYIEGSNIIFYRNISDIFDKCATNEEGKVANYIPQVQSIQTWRKKILKKYPQLARTDPAKWAVRWGGLESKSYNLTSLVFAPWMGSAIPLGIAMTSLVFNQPACHSPMPSGKPSSYIKSQRVSRAFIKLSSLAVGEAHSSFFGHSLVGFPL